jgi:ribosomal protein L31
MARSVTVGCRLPNGIIIEHPLDPKKRVEIAGLNKKILIGSTFTTTEIDAEIWDAWHAVNAGSHLLKSKALFVCRNAAEGAAMAKDSPKTGLEQMSQTAMGVKPADKD